MATMRRMVRVYESYVNGLMRWAELEGVGGKELLVLQNEITYARSIEAREIIQEEIPVADIAAKMIRMPEGDIAKISVFG